MKVFLLADPSSPHTIKWVNGLSSEGIEIFLYGLTNFNSEVYNKNVVLNSYSFPSKIVNRSEGNIYKLNYLKSLSEVKKGIRYFMPDILHAHYASSYGLIGALTGFHPYILSVWGSDVYNFPEKSFLHKNILRYNFSKSDRILSTSKIMAQEIMKYTNQDIEVTPFGIDVNKYKPSDTNSGTKELVIGTVKTLEKKYGVEHLIKAFALVKRKLFDKKLKLLIIGGGSQEEYLKNIVKELEIDSVTHFTGRIDPEKVVRYHNMIDIFCALSVEDSESFGVSILEANACAKPVIVSNVGGLQEIVIHGETGFVVSSRNPNEAAEAIEKLVIDSSLRIQMGNNGRKRVMQFYNWNDSLKQMTTIYKNTLMKKSVQLH